jgi:hypothetical protein
MVPVRGMPEIPSGCRPMWFPGEARVEGKAGCRKNIAARRPNVKQFLLDIAVRMRIFFNPDYSQDFFIRETGITWIIFQSTFQLRL